MKTNELTTKESIEIRRNISLLDRIPLEQRNLVFNQPNCDIDLSFIGFIETYEALSKIIPKDFTVIDLGCGYNAQCYYLEDHKSYVAVDNSDCIKFQSKNCKIFQESIYFFTLELGRTYDLNKTFVICNYVPLKDAVLQLVKNTFKNIYTFYPA